MQLNAVRERRNGKVSGRTQLAHVLERDDDLEVELLARARVYELDLTLRARDEASDLGERALRRGESDALEGTVDESLEPLQRQREMRAALRPGDRMHLVQDHGLDAAQGLARLRGQEQEERLGRRDQDVRRRLQHPPPFVGRRVARAHTNGELGAQPRERAPEVPLDVVVQRLQRRDVEESQPLTRRRVQPVDPDQEGGERLSRARRRLDEHVPAARNRGPAGRLSGGRRRERPLEPRPRAG